MSTRARRSRRGRARAVARLVLAIAALGVAGCTSASPRSESSVAAAGMGATSTTAAPAPADTVPATTAPPAPPTTAAPPAPPPPPPTTTTTPRVRSVVETGWSPFATAESITLLHPAARIERVGFHESNHEGARTLLALSTAASPTRLDARERGTALDTAADVVVDPSAEIRAPVTGRVKRAGTYVLYCKHSDDYLVIAPDDRPEWEVKMLHIDGVLVRSGDRVVAGETVVAPRATQLPFESQVDELRTADPAWPHVHIEVVDPAIRNVPSPNSGCN